MGSVSRQLEAIKQDHETLLARLPEAIGGPFVNSVYRFYPETSATIAEILSRQSNDMYKNHFRRVVVTEADDIYWLDGAEVIAIGNVEYKMWKLKFRGVWEWLNDSQISRQPLKDFRVLFTAPNSAISQFVDKEALNSATDRMTREFLQYLATENFLRYTIPNPAEDGKRLSDSQWPELAELRRMKVDKEGDVSEIDFDELVKDQEGSIPGPIYASYQLPRRLQDMVLECEKRMTVTYEGTMYVPIVYSSSKGSASGLISFPPSDVIGDTYRFCFRHPTDIAIAERNGYIKVDHQDTCIRTVHERLAEPEDLVEVNSVPGGPLSEGEAGCLLKADDQLTTEHFEIRLGWLWSEKTK
jgi:hypothetical protein